MSFEDHFSKLAGEYARHRPHYPPELFEYLASVSPWHGTAWDCGTGSGQAAIELVKYFERVVATDASPDQINLAVPHERIEYRVEQAEEIFLPASSVDLVTVAVAVHWFDLEKFYAEVKRVLRPAGVLAVWTYQLPVIEPAVDKVLVRYYSEVLSGYWPDRFHYVDEQYRTLPFPFSGLNPPHFVMRAEQDLSQLVGFLGTWSAARKYLEQTGRHPVNEIWKELLDAWGAEATKREVQWPLYLRVGRAGSGVGEARG